MALHLCQAREQPATCSLAALCSWSQLVSCRWLLQSAWVKSLWARAVSLLLQQEPCFKYSLSPCCCGSLPHMGGRLPRRGRWTVCGNGERVWCDLALRPLSWQYRARALKLQFRLFFINLFIPWSALRGRRGVRACAPVCWEGNLRGLLLLVVRSTSQQFSARAPRNKRERKQTKCQQNPDFLLALQILCQGKDFPRPGAGLFQSCTR